MFYTTIESSYGRLTLIGDDEGLSRLYIHNAFAAYPLVIDDTWQRNDAFFEIHLNQLEAYFAGNRQGFQLKLNPQGTAFQKAVWQALRDIPYGETWSYGQLAEHIGKPKASRAVGAANGQNPLPIIIPCHRVVGKNGKLTGFAFGIEMKRQLLEREGLTF